MFEYYFSPDRWSWCARSWVVWWQPLETTGSGVGTWSRSWCQTHVKLQDLAQRQEILSWDITSVTTVKLIEHIAYIEVEIIWQTIHWASTSMKSPEMSCQSRVKKPSWLCCIVDDTPTVAEGDTIPGWGGRLVGVVTWEATAGHEGVIVNWTWTILMV